MQVISPWVVEQDGGEQCILVGDQILHSTDMRFEDLYGKNVLIIEENTVGRRDGSVGPVSRYQEHFNQKPWRVFYNCHFACQHI